MVASYLALRGVGRHKTANIRSQSIPHKKENKNKTLSTHIIKRTADKQNQTNQRAKDESKLSDRQVETRIDYDNMSFS